MAVHTNAWEQSSPAGTEDVSQGDDRIRDLKLNLGERFEDMLYGFNSGNNDAPENVYGVKKLRFYPQSKPTSAANYFFLYGKDVSSKVELHCLDEEANEIQLTSNGKINGAVLKAVSIPAGAYVADSIDEDDIQLANNAALTAKNAAGDGTINLILAGTNDLPTLPDSAEMASNAAPVEDEAIVNKKYVDDQTGFKTLVADSVVLDAVSDALTTDGILTVIAHNASGGIEQLEVYADTGNPPTTVAANITTYYSAAPEYVTVSIPLKSGWRWKVSRTVGIITIATYRWMPLGS